MKLSRKYSALSKTLELITFIQLATIVFAEYQIPEPISIHSQSYVVYDTGWQYEPESKQSDQTLAIVKHGKYIKPKQNQRIIKEEV